MIGAYIVIIGEQIKKDGVAQQEMNMILFACMSNEGRHTKKQFFPTDIQHNTKQGIKLKENAR